MVSVNREATAKLAEFFRENPDVAAELHRAMEEMGVVGIVGAAAVTEPVCSCCTFGNHDTVCRGDCGVAEECCHPLYHTDRDAAEIQRTAEVRERMRIMDAQDARWDPEADPEQLSEPSEPLPIMHPDFVVHALALEGGFNNRCGAEGGRRTVRRDAIECPECFELTRPDR